MHKNAYCSSNTLSSCTFPSADSNNYGIEGAHAFEIHSVKGATIEFNLTLLETAGNYWDTRRCNIEFYINDIFIKGFYNIAFSGYDAIQGNGNHFDVRLYECEGYEDGYYIVNKHSDTNTNHIKFTLSSFDDGYIKILFTSH